MLTLASWKPTSVKSRYFNVKRSQYALLRSNYFGNYERSRRCRFSRIVGNTHSKSPFTLKVKRFSHHFFCLPERTRACKHTNTLLMYKNAFNKFHAAQPQFLRALNYLNRESTRVLSCEFISVHSSLTMISLRESDSCQFSYLYMNLFLLVP